TSLALFRVTFPNSSVLFLKIHLVPITFPEEGSGTNSQRSFLVNCSSSSCMAKIQHSSFRAFLAFLGSRSEVFTLPTPTLSPNPRPVCFVFEVPVEDSRMSSLPVHPIPVRSPCCLSKEISSFRSAFPLFNFLTTSIVRFNSAEFAFSLLSMIACLLISRPASSLSSTISWFHSTR
ncbi:Unknown protein, partial [Striga hermonthica]